MCRFVPSLLFAGHERFMVASVYRSNSSCFAWWSSSSFSELEQSRVVRDAYLISSHGPHDCHTAKAIAIGGDEYFTCRTAVWSGVRRVYVIIRYHTFDCTRRRWWWPRRHYLWGAGQGRATGCCCGVAAAAKPALPSRAVCAVLCCGINRGHTSSSSSRGYCAPSEHAKVAGRGWVVRGEVGTNCFGPAGRRVLALEVTAEVLGASGWCGARSLGRWPRPAAALEGTVEGDQVYQGGEQGAP